MSTWFQWNPNIDNTKEIGTSASIRYTLVNGTPVYLGADADAHAGRIVPISNIATQTCVGLAKITTTLSQYTKYTAELALWPMRIFTDNVSGATPPEAVLDNRVYLLNAGTFSDTDTNTSSHFYGQCNGVFSTGEFNGMYDLNLFGPSA